MTQDRSEGRLTYAASGVDIDSATEFVRRIKNVARRATRPEVLASVGPFGSLFKLGQYRSPVLVSSADGVGTKTKLAALLGRYEGVGRDLVNHCVNDILTCGAEPLFFLDYIGSSTLSVDQKVELVGGLAEACKESGCALIGGEMADMPNVYGAGDFDLVGFIVGVVEEDTILDGSKVTEGDVLFGLPSTGPHTNGYSLVRKLFGVGVDAQSDRERAILERHVPELGGTLGDALLAVHRCYYREVKPLLPAINALAHITGGGLLDNVPRVLPKGLAARFALGSWPVPAIFRLIQGENDVARDEMYRTFNMGIGMVLAVSPENAAKVQSELPEAMVIGEIVRQTGDQRVLLEEK